MTESTTFEASCAAIALTMTRCSFWVRFQGSSSVMVRRYLKRSSGVATSEIHLKTSGWPAIA